MARLHENKVSVIGSSCSCWLTSLWPGPLNAHTDYGHCNEMMNTVGKTCIRFCGEYQNLLESLDVKRIIQFGWYG